MSTAHLWVYGIIGTQPKGDPEKYYSFMDFQRELDPKATDYVVHIMSPGGDVFQGQAMYNALVNTRKKIRVQVEGVCASIATIFLPAADPGEVYMNESAQLMVHLPSLPNAGGDKYQLRTGADQLEQIETLLISAYRKKTKLPEETLRSMLNSTTWMLPDKAKELGFVDKVVTDMKAVAFADFKFLTNMEDNKRLTAIESMLAKISSWMQPKNEAPKNMTDTLADGTVITVDTEDGEWTGKHVTTQDGKELEPGDHPLQDGRVLVVGAGSMIESVREAAENKIENKDDMELKTKLEAAEARIKELESALEATNAVAVKNDGIAKAVQNKYDRDLKEVKAELEVLKNTTAGDATPPKKAVQTAPVNEAQLDPMKQWFKTNILDVRNTD